MLKTKIKPLFLIISFVILLFGTFLVYKTSGEKPSSDYKVLYNSSVRMEQALSAVASYCQTHGIEPEPEDINKTYIVGPYITELTSTVGYEDIKRTTVNPNNAAVMVRFFLDAGLKKGDTIGIGTSGSFPAYAIASLCAAEEMGLKVRVIASYGSSMFGATRPELNIVTILKILKDNNISSFNLVAVSPGGNGDSGVGAFDDFLFENTRGLVLSLASDSGALLIDTDNIVENISKRLELFGDIDCFVNIGGAKANSGGGSYSSSFPTGLVLSLDSIVTASDRGLNYEYADRGIPVINILNVKQIALDYGLAIDPVPLPKAGTGGVFYEKGYSVVLIVSTIVLSVGILFAGVVLTGREEKEGKTITNN